MSLSPDSEAVTPKMPTRYYQDSDSCDPHHCRRSPRFTHPHVLDVPPPTTRTARSSLYQPTSAWPVTSRLRLLLDSSSPLHAESSSSAYGPPVRLRLLSTPHRCDAVTFSYGALAYPDTDFHRAVCVRLRAH